MEQNELREIIKKVEISQGELASELGVSHSTVSLWLSGKRRIMPAMEKHIKRTAAELAEKKAS